MLGAMPKPKSKRPSTTKSRSSKQKAGKAKPKPSAKRAQRTKSARAAKSSGGTIDARVLAAIRLALEDDDQASARAEALAKPASPWVALGRVRAVRTS